MSTNNPAAFPERPSQSSPTAANPAAASPQSRYAGGPPATVPPPKSALKFTRTAAAWWALAIGALVLIVLLVFIAQNIDSVAIHFLGWQWSWPIGVSFLLAAVGGALITLAAGTARIMQLRRVAKRNLTRQPV